jgi:hypothetical protein
MLFKRDRRGYYGTIREFRGRWRVYWPANAAWAQPKRIGDDYPTVEAAAQAWDHFILERQGILRAFKRLNFPEPHRPSYDAAVAERDAQAREAREREAAELAARPVPVESYGEVHAWHLAGQTAEQIAARLDLHPNTVTRCLRDLESKRLASIGLPAGPRSFVEDDGEAA